MSLLYRAFKGHLKKIQSKLTYVSCGNCSFEQKIACQIFYRDSLFFVRQKKLGDGREGVTKKWANYDQVLFITYPLVKEEVYLGKTGSWEPLVG